MTGRMLGRALAWVAPAQRNTKAVRMAEKGEIRQLIHEECEHSELTMDDDYDIPKDEV